jgi:hypothetical protein
VVTKNRNTSRVIRHPDEQSDDEAGKIFRCTAAAAPTRRIESVASAFIRLSF